MGHGDTGIFDLTRGLTNGVWSVKPIVKKGNGTHGLRCGQKSAMSNGHLRNRASFVWYQGPYNKEPACLNVLDLDDPAYPIYAVKLPLRGVGERFGFHYIASLNQFVSFGIWGSPATAYCQRITIPGTVSLRDRASHGRDTARLDLRSGSSPARGPF